MPLPTTKIELLESLSQAYEKLDSEFDAVDSSNERVRGIEGNISSCDIVAYQIGWANLLIGWEQQELEGKTPIMPSKGFKWNQLGILGQSFYNRNTKKSLLQLRTEFKESYRKLVQWVESLTEQELFEPYQRNWTGNKWAMV
ncbi:MAG: ClbS/DfsB family four-helix bundle protein, partial [Gammaproteobacteria bacterium]|nr:ClbS/DfsB family four-helix bundle protein [Gammaproteobacteria bacterium]